MNPLLLCHHCGNRTSHELISKSYETEMVDLGNGPAFPVEWAFWFTKCDNCKNHALFCCLEDQVEDATSLWPREKQVSHTVPSEIKVAYEEAKKVKKISKIAFIILIRRALEILCKTENAKGRDLYAKIKQLGDKGVIPNTLTGMADLIRLLGNEGAHDSTLSIEDQEIELLDEFFQAIIEYVYIAPEKIKTLKAKLKK